MSEACGLPAGEGWSLGGHMGDSQRGGTVGGLGLSPGQRRGRPSVPGMAAHTAWDLAMPHTPLRASVSPSTRWAEPHAVGKVYSEMHPGQ